MPLIVLITTADGTVHRCGPDEPDAAWIPFAITSESMLPGGWKQASFSLRRRIDEDIPLRILDEVEIIDEAGTPIFEGFIQQLPRQHGDDFLLNVVCVGWQGHLLHDKSFREIYVDRELSRWSDASLPRRRQQLNDPTRKGVHAQWSVGTGSDRATALPGVVHETTRLVSDAAQYGMAESWYDGQGIPLGIVYSGLTCIGLSNGTNPDWNTIRLLSPSETPAADLSDCDVSTDHDGADGPSGGSAVATDDAKRYAVLQTVYGGTFTGDGSWFASHTDIAVHGRRGLGFAPVEGSFGGGCYIDDILADALGRAAPKLNFTTGPEGSIQRPPIAVAQAAYHEPGSVEIVVLDLNKYVQYEWGVGPGRTFFFRPTDPNRLCWEARLGRGIHLALEGDDAEHAYNGAIVKYALPDGTRRTAGPPGSGFDIEAPLLGDTDPDNTVNQHGYDRKWIELDISFPILDLYAVAIGTAYLGQAAIPSRSGDITLTWQVDHPTKGPRPVYEIFAGDYIRLSDHPADVPRRIISARYSHDGRQCQVTVGNDMNKVDAILEQLGVITRVRLGG